MATDECLTDVDPVFFPLSVLQGWNSSIVNAAARSWINAGRPGARMTPVTGLTAVRTSVQYTVIDLAAASTPAERSAAMAYVREVATLPHAMTKYHMFLVYEMHLVNSRCFQNLRYARIVGTTSRPGCVSGELMSSAFRVRVRCPLVVPHQLSKLAEAAIAGDSVPAARKYAHEALKTCLDPSMAYLALLDAAAGELDHDTICELAEVEHTSHLITRPVHALELAALLVSSGTA
jgi:hypothetical protein